MPENTPAAIEAEALRLMRIGGHDLARYIEVRGAINALADIDAAAVCAAQATFDAEAPAPEPRRFATPLVILIGDLF